MNTSTIESCVTLEVTRCCVCGTEFAVPEVILNTARKKGGYFYCPNGHHLGWAQGVEQTELNRLKREKASLAGQLDQAKADAQKQRKLREVAERSATAQKSQATQARNKLKRVARGTCPCCQRSFTNLRRHMETKHPENVKAAAVLESVSQ